MLRVLVLLFVLFSCQSHPKRIPMDLDCVSQNIHSIFIYDENVYPRIERKIHELLAAKGITDFDSIAVSQEIKSEIFMHHPDVISNNIRIAKYCHTDTIRSGVVKVPLPTDTSTFEEYSWSQWVKVNFDQHMIIRGLDGRYSQSIKFMPCIKEIYQHFGSTCIKVEDLPLAIDSNYVINTGIHCTTHKYKGLVDFSFYLADQKVSLVDTVLIYTVTGKIRELE